MATGDLFKDQFLSCRYDGIGPLPLRSFRRSGDCQAVARYKFPRVPGQMGEDLGREPLVITGEILFFATINTRLYPEYFVKITRLKSEPGAKFFTDPDLGPIEGRFTQWEPEFTPQRVNGCVVHFTFEEFTDLLVASQNDVIQPLPKAQAAAGVVDAGIAALGISAGATTFTEDMDSLETLLAEPSSTVQSIESFANTYRAKVALLLAQKDLIDPRNYQLYRECQAMAASVQEIAAQAKSNAPQDVPVTLNADTWPLVLAQQTYGDRRRAKDIVEKNPMGKPYYPRGTELRIPDR